MDPEPDAGGFLRQAGRGAGVETKEGAVAEFRCAVYRAPVDGFPDLAIILREDDEVLLCRPVASVAEGEQVIELISRGLAELVRRDEGGES